MDNMEVEVDERRVESREMNLEMEFSSGSSSTDSDNSENGDESDNAGGVEFGLYEPILTVEDEIAQQENLILRPQIDDRRLQNTDWCQCGGHCMVKDSFKAGDCICCREIQQVREEADRNGEQCITQTEPFYPAILHPTSLYIGWLQYTEKWRRQAKAFNARANEKYRYVAYRQLVRWCWGWLGKDIRVQLPACAHGRIMNEYPDAGGQYKGTELRPLEVD